MPETSRQILAALRNGSNFQWYVIPLLAFAIYVYAAEAEKKNWSLILAGLAFWGIDWFNEIWNGVFFHLNGYAPLWGTPSNSALVILAGLNIEVMLMFSIDGILWTKFLPAKRSSKILGVNSRWFIAFFASVLSAAIEVLLNKFNVLVWLYPWWDANSPWLMFLYGYLLPFLFIFWLFDLDDLPKKIKIVGGIWAFDIIALTVFIGLGWI
jgi:hypothetical protein